MNYTNYEHEESLCRQMDQRQHRTGLQSNMNGLERPSGIVIVDRWARVTVEFVPEQAIVGRYRQHGSIPLLVRSHMSAQPYNAEAYSSVYRLFNHPLPESLVGVQGAVEHHPLSIWHGSLSYRST